MIYRQNPTILADEYIPDLAYRNGQSSLVIIADYPQKVQFMFDTAVYYAEKEIPVVFVTDNTAEIASSFSTIPDAERVTENPNVTYHTDSLDTMLNVLVRIEDKRIVRPVIIFLKNLPEIVDDETEEKFRFAESVNTLFTQVYMFAAKEYDYIPAFMDNIAKVDYYWNADEEKNIMKLEFTS